MQNDIQNFMNERSKRFGGILLLTAKDAEELIKLLVYHNTPIYGLDGIFVLPEGQRPSMDDSMDVSADFQQKVPLHDIAEKLIRFIKHRAHEKDLHFEVVFQHS